MLVRDRMTAPVITVQPKTPIFEALAMMKEKRIRRLPVIKGKRLAGIVTWTDLMRASPSSATSLSAWEIPYLLMKAAVGEVMTREPITVSPTSTLEEAALLMRQFKIGGLPVLEGQTLVGIITESDLFDAFIALMGVHRGGARVTIQPADGPESLEEIVRTIHGCEVQIHSLAAYAEHGVDRVVVRLDSPYPLHVIQALEESGNKIIHFAPLRGTEPVLKGA
ncbi:MAG TPA: CBS and ACT domain-containing protein [bacterium]|jgi:acetoin utilization protein AcuB|nr:CBS and ACT domain-containing protein [bacterium]